MAALYKLPIRGRHLAAVAVAALAVWVAADLATGAGVWTAVGRYTASLLVRSGPTRDLGRAIAPVTGVKSKRILRVWDWWSPSITEEYGQYFRELESRFEADHPDVDVVFQAIPFRNYEQKLAIGMMGRNPPDVFQCSVVWAEGLYRRGMMRELNDFVGKTPELQQDKFMPSAWYHNHYKGKILGIPHIVDAACLLWNLDMLKANPKLHFMFERGRDGGTDSQRIRFDAVKDWEHFRWIVAELTASASPGGTDVKPAGFIMNAYSMGIGSYMPWAATNGVAIQDRAGTRATFDSPAGAEALQFMIDLHWKDGVCPPFKRELESHAAFQKRQIACSMAGTFSGKYIDRNTGWTRFGMTAFPPGPKGTGQKTVAWANMMVISSRCRDPELAWEFIRLVAGAEYARRRLELLKMNSPRLDLYEGEAWPKKVRQYPYMHNMKEICAAGEPLFHTQTQAVKDEVRPILEHVMLNWSDIRDGKEDRYRSAADALHDAAERVNGVYRRYNRYMAKWERPAPAAGGE